MVYIQGEINRNSKNLIFSQNLLVVFWNKKLWIIFVGYFSLLSYFLNVKKSIKSIQENNDQLFNCVQITSNQSAKIH